jgi:hypothetical protein
MTFAIFTYAEMSFFIVRLFYFRWKNEIFFIFRFFYLQRMASIRTRKPHIYRSTRTNNTSLDASHVTIPISDTNSSSLSSIASTSTIERSPKFRHRMLSSTLKSK